MFYVIYNTVTKTLRNEDGVFGSFEQAEKFRHPDPFVILYAGERFVGPYIEGEAP